MDDKVFFCLLGGVVVMNGFDPEIVSLYLDALEEQYPDEGWEKLKEKVYEEALRNYMKIK